MIGWVRCGDVEHENSGAAIVMSDSDACTVSMEIGKNFAGETFHDVMEACSKPVVIDRSGVGEFRTAPRSVSVWVRKKAFEDIMINE